MFKPNTSADYYCELHTRIVQSFSILLQQHLLFIKRAKKFNSSVNYFNKLSVINLPEILVIGAVVVTLTVEVDMENVDNLVDADVVSAELDEDEVKLSVVLEDGTLELNVVDDTGVEDEAVIDDDTVESDGTLAVGTMVVELCDDVSLVAVVDVLDEDGVKVSALESDEVVSEIVDATEVDVGWETVDVISVEAVPVDG